MKILVVSNLYPPYYHGGYEVRCAQVGEALQNAGHDVRVLTTVYGLPLGARGEFQPSTEVLNGVRVDRWLHNFAFGPQQSNRPWTWYQARRELADARLFLKVLDEFRPDVVNWWNMNGVSMILLPLPRTRGIPDVHWIEYPWMINEYGPHGEKAALFWANLWDGAWGPPIIRPLLRWIGRAWERRVTGENIATRHLINQPTHVSFVSEYLRTLYREGGLEFPSSDVLFGGIPVASFYASVDSRPRSTGKLRVLYASQLTVDRGLHSGIEAIGQLPVDVRRQLTLTVAGSTTGTYRDYYQRIASRVTELGLQDTVTFLGKVPHEEMAQLFKSHDLLVFLSTREEGLPLVMVEAMLAGCAVITTGSGGAIEIAELARLPLLPKGDSVVLVKTLTEYVTDRQKLQELAANGQEVALREFSLETMMRRWQDRLERVVRERR
ncbi:MAG TPA: glycosyltransferase family 4 protein [Nitrospira sp.]|nr:glycosyltransferase family 4 protein [Nitrospira sp.]